MRTTNANQQPPTVGKLLTTNQAADYLGISRWTIYELVKQGRIRPIIGMKSWRFKTGDLDSIKWRTL